MRSCRIGFGRRCRRAASDRIPRGRAPRVPQHSRKHAISCVPPCTHEKCKSAAQRSEHLIRSVFARILHLRADDGALAVEKTNGRARRRRAREDTGRAAAARRRTSVRIRYAAARIGSTAKPATRHTTSAAGSRRQASRSSLGAAFNARRTRRTPACGGCRRARLPSSFARRVRHRVQVGVELRHEADAEFRHHTRRLDALAVVLEPLLRRSGRSFRRNNPLCRPLRVPQVDHVDRMMPAPGHGYKFRRTWRSALRLRPKRKLRRFPAARALK